MGTFYNAAGKRWVRWMRTRGKEAGTGPSRAQSVTETQRGLGRHQHPSLWWRESKCLGVRVPWWGHQIPDSPLRSLIVCHQ